MGNKKNEISRTKAFNIVAERQGEILDDLKKNILERGLYDLNKIFYFLDELEAIKVRLLKY